MAEILSPTWIQHLIQAYGLWVLFTVVMLESMGVPMPGETALVTAAVYAGSTHQIDIASVVLVAAAAAVIGDNIGYLIGRKGGRWLLERPGAMYRQRTEVLRVGEPFFARHGPKAVFLGRFLLGLRVWASWLAGATRMQWRSFLLWNALGGITWATVIGLIAYFLGRSAGNLVQTFGLVGLAAALLALGSGLYAHRRHRRRGATGTATPASASAASGATARREGTSGREASEPPTE